jgi:predicted TIM-barrel enzyme
MLKSAAWPMLLWSRRRHGQIGFADDLIQVKAAISAPLLAGSGVTPASLPDILSACDGAIVGSFFKKDGNIKAPTDIERVKELMTIAKRRD